MKAWHQAYRALDHGQAKSRCRDKEVLQKFPDDIVDFANTFASMQAKRHTADYDPSAQFSKSEVLQDVAEAEDVIDRFGRVPIKDRRAFSVFVLLKTRPKS